MQSLAIRQAEWDSPFLSVARQDTLSHFISLHSLCQSTPPLEQSLPRCKYCKAYPFSIGETIPEGKQQECQMCGGINECQMRFCLASPTQHRLFTSHSYILPLDLPPRPFTLILFLQVVDAPEIHHFIEALKAIVQTLTLPTSVLLMVGGKLAVVDFVESPELVILSQDNNIHEKIEETRCVLTVSMAEELLKVLLVLGQQAKEIKQTNEAYSMNILEAVTSQLDQKKCNRTHILLWIGKVPSIIKPLPFRGICTIALLTLTHKLEKPQLLMQLSRNFTEVHYFAPPETSTQLYYKLHQILSQDYLGRVISGVITLRTNQQYCGDLRSIPDKFINAATPPIEVSFATTGKFKMQICAEMANETGAPFKLIANCEEAVPRRRIVWFQRATLVSRALVYVMQSYVKARREGKDPGFDYFFINSELQRFGLQFQNRTELYRGLLHHMGNYFKEFQKDAYKTFLPFGLVGRKELLLVFYPLWQGGILHHWDRMWVAEGGEDNVEWFMDILGTPFTPRDQKLPIFYQLCIDHDHFCYIEQ